MSVFYSAYQVQMGEARRMREQRNVLAVVAVVLLVVLAGSLARQDRVIRIGFEKTQGVME